MAYGGTGLTGRVALVTGAAGGIGAAVAAALGTRGALVAATDADIGALQAETGRLRAAGHHVSAYKVDVTDTGDVQAVVTQVEDEMGPIDVLVNVAGVLRTGPVLAMADEDWRHMFEVNTQGVFVVSRTVARRMALRRRGTIVTVGSNAAVVPRMHMAGYCASKAASAAFTKCLGLELAGHGIRCNVVAPGSTDTSMLRSMFTADYGPRAVIEGAADRFRLGIPLAKIAEPSEIADAVVFLASDQASHITMQELCVDGGAALGR